MYELANQGYGVFCIYRHAKHSLEDNDSIKQSLLKNKKLNNTSNSYKKE